MEQQGRHIGKVAGRFTFVLRIRVSARQQRTIEGKAQGGNAPCLQRMEDVICRGCPMSPVLWKSWFSQDRHHHGTRLARGHPHPGNIRLCNVRMPGIFRDVPLQGRNGPRPEFSLAGQTMPDCAKHWRTASWGLLCQGRWPTFPNMQTQTWGGEPGLGWAPPNTAMGPRVPKSEIG